MPKETRLPLVYSCSGCSSVAQLANDCALRLDREGKAQMSCISGVGGGVTPLVLIARSGRPILALDGCALACAKACMQKAGVTADRHLILNQEGAKKRFHSDATEEETSQIWELVCTELNEISAISEINTTPLQSVLPQHNSVDLPKKAPL